MGLHIQSLKSIPENVQRDYFIYLLDYGWDEPLGEVLVRNFDKMAKVAAESNAVVIVGTDRVHFEDEVFSWHSINGEDAKQLLPAILITNRHPSKFRESYGRSRTLMVEENLKFILIPLKKFCENTTDVVTLIDKLFRDIQSQKDLSEFSIEREMKKGIGRAIVDGIVLKPNIYGFGYDFNSIINFFKEK
ncbi:MAG TPA: hypothetical protein VGB02_07210 [Pyrinomonadaceae bacterium]|jgi:hypothetical protein